MTADVTAPPDPSGTDASPAGGRRWRPSALTGANLAALTTLLVLIGAPLIAVLWRALAPEGVELRVAAPAEGEKALHAAIA